MANDIQLYIHNQAPRSTTYSFDASGDGSDWDTEEDYVVCVEACYDLTQADDNIYQSGFVNYGIDTDISALAIAIEPEQAAVSPANATDQLVVVWVAPDGPLPDHYNVYMQVHSGVYTYSTYGMKLNAAPITNDKTTVTIDSPTEQGTLTDMYIADVDVANKYIYVLGNYVKRFGYSTPLIADYGGDAIVTSVVAGGATLNYDARGTVTRIEVADAITDVAQGELLRYNNGRATAYQTAGGPWGGYYGFSLDPVLQISPTMRNRTIVGYDGYSLVRSLANNTPVEYLDVTVCGISCNYEQWARLMEWMTVQTQLWLIDRNGTWDNAGSYYPWPQYLVRLVDTDYIGSIGKNMRNSYRLRFEVILQKNLSSETW